MLTDRYFFETHCNKKPQIQVVDHGESRVRKGLLSKRRSSRPVRDDLIAQFIFVKIYLTNICTDDLHHAEELRREFFNFN